MFEQSMTNFLDFLKWVIERSTSNNALEVTEINELQTENNGDFGEVLVQLKIRFKGHTEPYVCFSEVEDKEAAATVTQ